MNQNVFLKHLMKNTCERQVFVKKTRKYGEVVAVARFTLLRKGLFIGQSSLARHYESLKGPHFKLPFTASQSLNVTVALKRV